MKILAVDDDPIILDLLRELLSLIGHTNIVTAESAIEALEVIENSTDPIDCFLFDIQMPVMDGIQLVTNVRSIGRYQHTPILMITAMSDKHYIDRAFFAGATDYVNKPFDIKELSNRINTIEELLIGRRGYTDNLFSATGDSKSSSSVNRPTFSEPLFVNDVDGVIGFTPMQNYLKQLSRLSLFGCSAFAFTLQDAQRLYDNSTEFDFTCAITDVSEAISETLKPNFFLMSHAGGGNFACVSDSHGLLNLEEIQSNVNDRLTDMDTYFSDGRPMYLTVTLGQPIRLNFKSGNNVSTVLRQACINAENTNPSTTITKKEPSGLLGMLGVM
ncbi:response regulator [Amylibacter sp. SFDW26]|uniref:response regulator n=1 Tax=Amylibacter sp. SFDW26 TaxID=2652722 RepID=UPI0012627E99|nr:response regulator [Amylibacter sp. SFDW26]KAB7613769.1 response regulator [Amylibacter sp. SFDW26]